MKRNYRMCSFCKKMKRTTSASSLYFCRSCKPARKKLRKNPHKLLPTLKNTQLLILNHVTSYEGSTAKKISKNLHIPLSTTYDHLSELVQWGILIHLDDLYFLSDEAITKNNQWVKLLSQVVTDYNKKYRLHGAQGKMMASSPPTNYEQLKHKYLNLYPVKSGFKGFKIKDLDDYTFIFYSPKSIAVSLPTIFGNSPAETLLNLYEKHTKFMINWLESNVVGLKIDTFVRFKIEMGHLAIINSKIAKDYLAKTKSNLHTEFVTIDNSHGSLTELETTNSDSFLADMEQIAPIEDDYVAGRISLDEAIRRIRTYTNNDVVVGSDYQR